MAMKIKIPLVTFMGTGLLLGSLTVCAEDLDQIYQLSLQNDPTFKSAQAVHDSANQYVKISRSAFLPQLDVGASYSKNSGKSLNLPGASGDYNSNGYSATLTQSLYNSSSYSTHSINKNYVKQADADYQSAQQDLIIRVATQYFNVLGAQDNLEFSEAETHANARQLEQTKQRFEVGLVAITDVHEAQARYDLSVSQKIAAENVLNNEIEALRALTGQYHHTLAQLRENTPLEPPDPNDIEHWTKLALDQNSQLRSSLFKVEEARDSVDLQRAGYKPRLDFTATKSHSDTDLPDSSAYDSTVYTISFGMNLFAGGGTNARVQQAEYNLTQATEQLVQTRRSTQLNIRSAFLGVLSAISQVKALNQLVISSKSRLKASEAGFDVGTRTTVDVLDARQDLFNSQRQYARARYDYLLERLRLKQASGTLEEQDLKQINNWLK